MEEKGTFRYVESTRKIMERKKFSEMTPEALKFKLLLSPLIRVCMDLILISISNTWKTDLTGRPPPRSQSEYLVVPMGADLIRTANTEYQLDIGTRAHRTLTFSMGRGRPIILKCLG